MFNAAESRAPQIFFITFGAGDIGLEEAAQRLGRQAVESGLFNHVEVLSGSDLPSHVTDLFSPIRFEDCRGFGYWAWKPFLINQKIETLLDGDVLVYLDAGFEINTRGAERFTYYLDFVARHDLLVFPIPYQHRLWVKRHSSLQIESRNFFRNQVAAGFLMMRVSDVSRRVVKRWYQLSFEDSGAALADDFNDGKNQHDGFKEHRHDQSILTHVVIDEKLTVLDRDETHHTPWEKGEKFPFLALRNKSGVSRLDRIFRMSRRRALFRRVSSRLNLRYLLSMISQKYPLGKTKLLELFKLRFK